MSDSLIVMMVIIAMMAIIALMTSLFMTIIPSSLMPVSRSGEHA